MKSLLLFRILLLLPSSVFAQDDDTPTATPLANNDCDNLNLGDFTFLLVSASDPFDEISFFGFDSLPGNLDLYLTDNAWNGESFETTEGILQLTTPPEGIPAGSTVGVGPAADVYQFGHQWTTVQGAFALSTHGDQVFLYCMASNNQPRPIAAISYNGDFVAPNLSDYGTNTSAVPNELVENGGAIILPPGQHRWYYQGPMDGEINQMKANIQTVDNWKGERTDHSGSNRRAVSWMVATVVGMAGSMWM